ncbi:DUF5710 domain-containing protein [Comamonas endophytica]|uniref:DUF5710 domain-containing protein n=1 Tax=Comamonas endophytica TaxID=2949090 RepID=A0ABY6GGP9_9BURK|nr:MULTISPECIES: DUF5710 domain-containing protein [unclassified Acidovorax]MCD2514397.1 DUF5710 domain-containing protein [Acidovorax sp. D4N7]UYG53687.1 DUF5710 domain-containing protein [Acidovorax sp. 5MLIR]
MKQVQLRLNVAFSAKDQAKGLGARWDPQQRSWYVPFGLDIQPFQAWWPDSLKGQGGEAAGHRDNADAVIARKPPAARVMTAKPAIVTGPDEVAPDHTDKLPWED